MSNQHSIGAATALWLWHDWKRGGNEVGWYRNNFLQEFKELQGYGRTQGPKRQADPTAAATIAFDIALTVDRILGEFEREEAQMLILRAVGRMTFAELGDQFGRSSTWACDRYRPLHRKFCTLLDKPGPKASAA
ncbi:hypothetical protein [Salinisphaera hydrothermalis]|uniref:hypothetical protein n=1 Tax=Salinisphaera hydrothermalis TaxID=563188 RepID=UPI0033409890